MISRTQRAEEAKNKPDGESNRDGEVAPAKAVGAKVQSWPITSKIFLKKKARWRKQGGTKKVVVRNAREEVPPSALKGCGGLNETEKKDRGVSTRGGTETRYILKLQERLV